MDKFVRVNLSQWGYQLQGSRSFRNYHFATRHRRRRRIPAPQRPLNKHVDKFVAVATIEALIAIINVLERE